MFLTTYETAEALTKRGYRARDGGPVRLKTVIAWCGRGLFAGAYREGSARRGYWQIPEEAVAAFEPPRIGNPHFGKREYERWQMSSSEQQAAKERGII